MAQGAEVDGVAVADGLGGTISFEISMIGNGSEPYSRIVTRFWASSRG
jgi:hypothetical protein